MIAIPVPGNTPVICIITEFVNGTHLTYRFGDNPNYKHSSELNIDGTKVSVLLKKESVLYEYVTTIEELVEKVPITIKT